jgi:hypothetical protein
LRENRGKDNANYKRYIEYKNGRCEYIYNQRGHANSRGHYRCTSGTVIAAMILFPNYTFLINPDSDWSVPTPGKKLQGKSSGSGNIYITVWYHYE